MTTMNQFEKVNIMGAGANGARTENGAISYDTIGTALLDQFGKAGSYRGRSIDDVWNDQSKLWSEDALTALRFPFYLRLITRKTNIFENDDVKAGTTESVQRGQGVRDEAFKRLLWIARYHPTEFYENLWLLPIVGSWKDLWTLMAFDGAIEYLDYMKFFNVIASGINDDNHKDLVKKYMPRIRSDKNCKTAWAKRSNRLAKLFARAAGWSYRDYREFKATGKAHEFQKLICNQQYDKINWGAISGKALLNLVTGKFLNNHNLTESYVDWIKSQPTAKFNGYAFELLNKLRQRNYNPSLVEKITIDKQFDNLIKTASENGGAISGNVLCALDTSGSMAVPFDHSKPNGMSAFDICVSLGVYFSELNKGEFHNTVAMFDDTSKLKKLTGDSFTDKVKQIVSCETAWGSTNFQSVIDLIVETRKKHPQIPLEDYPKTLLVVSDMQFNPSGRSFLHRNGSIDEKTNYEAAIEKLRKVFPEEFVNEFKIVWWFCTNRVTPDFPSTMDDSGTYMFSGYDGAIISFLLGGEGIKDPETGEVKKQPSMEEIVNAALSQEVLALVNA